MPGAFELVARLEPELRRVVTNVVGRDLIDDAWTECVLERCERVLELWDPKRTPKVERYFVWAMAAYAGKWLHRHRKFIGQETRVPRSGAPVPHKPVRDSQEAELMLQELEPYDAWLIRTHVIEGHTFKSMADAAGVSKRTIILRYQSALARARELFDGD